MHGREKSDPAIGAGKPTNKAEATSVVDAAEPVEQRAGAKGNASGQSTHRTQGWERVSQALERVRKAARPRKKEKNPSPLVERSLRRHTPKVGAVCLNWACTDLRAGRGAILVPTAIEELNDVDLPGVTRSRHL